jgi:hypothetical protein
MNLHDFHAGDKLHLKEVTCMLAIILKFHRNTSQPYLSVSELQANRSYLVLALLLLLLLLLLFVFMFPTPLSVSVVAATGYRRKG